MDYIHRPKLRLKCQNFDHS